MGGMVIRLQSKKIEGGVAILKRHWFRRNKFVIEKKFINPKGVITQVLLEVTKFWQAQLKLNICNQASVRVNRLVKLKNLYENI